MWKARSQQHQVSPPRRPRFILTIFLNQCSRKPLLMGGNWPKDDSGLRSIGFSSLLSQPSKAVPLEGLGQEGSQSSNPLLLSLFSKCCVLICYPIF